MKTKPKTEGIIVGVIPNGLVAMVWPPTACAECGRAAALLVSRSDAFVCVVCDPGEARTKEGA